MKECNSKKFQAYLNDAFQNESYASGFMRTSIIWGNYLSISNVLKSSKGDGGGFR